MHFFIFLFGDLYLIFLKQSSFPALILQAVSWFSKVSSRKIGGGEECNKSLVG